MRKSKNKPDRMLVFLILFLMGWGSIMLATTSFPLSLQKYGNSWHYFSHQIFFGFLPGIFIFLFCFKKDLKFFKKISFYLFLANLFLTALVFLPKIGLEINGARRWVKLGPIVFQPSEFLKISFLIYLSAWLSNKLEMDDYRIKKKKTKIEAFFVFLTSLFVLFLILICQPDMSTLIIIGFLGFLVYFCSRTLWWHSLLIVILGGVIIGIFALTSPYRMARVSVFLHPQADPLGKAYHFKQALIAIGSGKIAGIEGGLALGLSRQKFGFLPNAINDSIFAVLGEEFGFLGTTLLIILFLSFGFWGMKTSLSAKDEFSKLLGIGISFWIPFQALFNIGGIIGIMPLAGIPLPFFSYGASHFITEIAGVGLLLNISKSG